MLSSIFDAKTDAIVNPVNIVGVMGKGLALEFKIKYPDNFKAYLGACRAGKIKIGKVFTYDLGTGETPRYIINFPTKAHWKYPSTLEYIEQGLVSLIDEVESLGIDSIAVPALGCGLGGLSWVDVQARIIRAFNKIPHVNLVLIHPLA